MDSAVLSARFHRGRLEDRLALGAGIDSIRVNGHTS